MIPTILTLTVTPTISTGIYATGDNVGGLIKFKSPNLTQNQRCIIQNIVLCDQDSEKVSMDVVIFDSNPSVTTFTDNAAQDIADADLKRISHVENMIIYRSFADNSVSSSGAITIPTVYTDAIYVCLVNRGAPTYTATSDLTLRITLIQE